MEMGLVSFASERALLVFPSGFMESLSHCRRPLTACSLVSSSECAFEALSDIQPDIFSYLLHLMYTGKMAPQLIDPVRLEQGIKFLHAIR